MSDRTDLSHEGTMDRRSRLGAAIRRARGDRSQTELGRAVSRPQSSISAWEAGTVDLPVERVSEIELYLGLAPGSLLVDAGYISDAAARELSDPVEPMNKDNADRSKNKDGNNHNNRPAGDGSRGRAHRQSARTTVAVPPADRDFVDSLVDWLFDYRQLIEALALVRETEPDASAVAGISQLRRVAELRTSWELWENISRRSSDQIREIVERELAPSTVDLIRFAIWNEPPRYTRSARRLDG